MREFVAMVDGSSDWLSKARRVSNDLSKWCEDKSKYWMKKFGLYHWSDNAKMLVFCLVFLGTPTVVATYFILFIVLWTQIKIGELCDRGERRHLKTD